MNQHPDLAEDGEAEDDSASASPARHDFAPEKKKRGRPPKVRHDSPADLPINGFGDPFVVKLAPGWAGFWASEHDMGKYAFRPWEIATWKDPRILGYEGGAEGKKGTAIKYRELTLHIMSEANAVALRRGDPYRQAHQSRRAALKMEAQSSAASGKSGKWNEINI